MFILGACVTDDHEPAHGTPATQDRVPALPTDNIVPEPTFTSADDFNLAVRAGANPFHLLRPEDLARFRETMVFRDGRVESMDYESMRALLPPDQYLDLMYGFGFEHSDHPMFAGIKPPHPTAPKPGRDYCVLHGPRPLGAANPPPAIPNADVLFQRINLQQGVLARLSPAALQELRETATFNEHGITSFRFARIKAELTSEDYAKLLSMFGMIKEGGVENYYCHSRGTCKKSTDFLCNLNTC